MKTIEKFKNYRLIALSLFSMLVIASCSDDDDVDIPDEENEVEVITDVTLIFTSTTDEVRVTAQDPDGEGIQELMVDGPITLSSDSQYILTYEITNALDSEDPEDIGAEILEEDNEHQFFFSFTEDVFDSPLGDGNIDNASDAINYDDRDENGNPVGLQTSWTTGPVGSGTFTVRLQHQPDLKSATTGADDGDTDFDLTFVLNIE